MTRQPFGSFERRTIRRQVDWVVAHPESQYCDIYTHFRTIYGPRSSHYTYALAYIGALETFEPIDLQRVVSDDR